MRSDAGLSKAEARRTRVDAGLTKDEVAVRRELLTPKVVALRARGATWVEIAAEVGVPRSTVQKWVASVIPPQHRKPKSPKPVAGAERPPVTSDVATKVIMMHEQGQSSWVIAKRLNLRVNEVDRVVARSKLATMVEDGRLTIRFAEGEELERLRRDRERHDRAALEDRDRVLRAA